MRAVCVGLLAALLGGPAEAARLAVPLPELCAGSALVVLAEVTGSEPEPTEQGLLLTSYDLAVIRVIRGELPAEPPRVIVPGGSDGEVRLLVSEAAKLQVDGRYLLLLSRRAQGGYLVRGGPDGAIPVAAGEEEAALARLGSCRAP